LPVLVATCLLANALIDPLGISRHHDTDVQLRLQERLVEANRLLPRLGNTTAASSAAHRLALPERRGRGAPLLQPRASFERRRPLRAVALGNNLRARSFSPDAACISFSDGSAFEGPTIARTSRTFVAARRPSAVLDDLSPLDAPRLSRTYASRGLPKLSHLLR